MNGKNIINMVNRKIIDLEKICKSLYIITKSTYNFSKKDNENMGKMLKMNKNELKF